MQPTLTVTPVVDRSDYMVVLAAAKIAFLFLRQLVRQRMTMFTSFM